MAYNGSANQKRRSTKPAPPLAEGQERCPVCRRPLYRNEETGKLPRHVDLWSDKCWGPAAEFDPPIA